MSFYPVLHTTLSIPLNTPPTTTRQAKQCSLVAQRNINVSTSNSEVTGKSKHISTALSITPVNATLLCVVKTKGLTLCRTGKGAVVQFTRELRIINLIFYNWTALWLTENNWRRMFNKIFVLFILVRYYKQVHKSVSDMKNEKIFF